MVTSVTSFSRTGLSDWLIQRVTSLVLLATATAPPQHIAMRVGCYYIFYVPFTVCNFFADGKWPYAFMDQAYGKSGLVGVIMILLVLSGMGLGLGLLSGWLVSLRF